MSVSTPPLDEEVEEFRERIKQDAEQLVLKKFPRKMLELDKLLNSDQFSLQNLGRIKCDPNIPIPEIPTNNISNHQSSSKTPTL